MTARAASHLGTAQTPRPGRVDSPPEPWPAELLATAITEGVHHPAG